MYTWPVMNMLMTILFTSQFLLIIFDPTVVATQLLLRQVNNDNINGTEHITNERELIALKSLGSNPGIELGLCEGDCDNDDECIGELKCFQRKQFEIVPGCDGSSKFRGMDFCYSESSSSTNPPATVDGRFRIKLYWEPGYFWQEETIEKKWCLECVAARCYAGVNIEIDSCDDHYTFFDFVGDSSNEKQIRVSGTNLCIELVTSSVIQLKDCNPNEIRQKFTGTFGESRFEISPNANPGCLSNSHHPRKNELVYRQKCDGPRLSTTSYWNKYYG